MTGSTIEAAASKCHALTRSAYAHNSTWSSASAVCALMAPGDASMTVLVYATDYFEEINGGGVNRVDGLATICNPTAIFTIPSTL